MKNLVCIFADGLRFDARSTHTAHLHTFCKNEHTAVISAHPLPASYRATLWSGKTVLDTGMVREGLRLYPDHSTLPQTLSQAGYATAFVGEWRLYGKPFVPRGRNRLGFDEAFYSFAGTDKKRWVYTDDEKGKPASPVSAQTETAVFLDTLSMLQCGQRPFAAFLNLTDSGVIPDEFWQDTPLEQEPLSCGVRTEQSIPPEALRTVCDNAERRRALAFGALLDTVVGMVLEKLDLEKTIVVVTSSCGALNAEHCRKSDNCFFEEAVRVPFFTLGTALTQPLLSTQDLPAVLLHALDLGEAVPARESVLLWGMGPRQSFRDGYEWRGLRTATHTYAVCKRDDTEYLFDLAHDPLQLDNLALSPEQNTLRKELRYLMYRQMLDADDTFPKNSYYKKFWVDHGDILPFLR